MLEQIERVQHWNKDLNSDRGPLSLGEAMDKIHKLAKQAEDDDYDKLKLAFKAGHADGVAKAGMFKTQKELAMHFEICWDDYWKYHVYRQKEKRS